jgi:NAD(P)-dependent dehydrogenase (short-subunit alcohol dehydrogenase family)
MKRPPSGAFFLKSIVEFPMDLKNKVALIAGGARIGQTVALELARRGCHVAVTYRTSRKSAYDTVRKAVALGVKAVAIPADLRKLETGRRVPNRVVRSLGRLDILIHMASLYRKTPVRLIKADTWKDQLDTDLLSAYWLSAGAAPWMIRRGEGRIILFADWVSASGRPRYKEFAPYYVSKHGVIGLAEALALEWAPEILVNAIAPGPILPPARLSPREEKAVMQITPLGRWGGAEEVAKAVLFLIETDFVTGECIRVDGGRHLY